MEGTPLPRYIDHLYEERFGKTKPDIVVTVEQRMAAKRKKKEARRAKQKLERETGEGSQRPAATMPAAATAPALDTRPEVTMLFANLLASKKKLRSLLLKYSGEWTYFDPVYRYYHHSFKVFGLQTATLELVSALQALAPNRTLNPRFSRIVSEGTGKTFEREHNRRWDEVTRPILEAFFHARFFLDTAVRSAHALQAPPQSLPSDWAALLSLYELR